MTDRPDAPPTGSATAAASAAFGAYLRAQRQLARLSLRQLAELTRISNPYLSQIERGLHQPSVTIIRALAEALDLSAEELLTQAAGLADVAASEQSTEAAIKHDPRLDGRQKAALLAVYRSMVDRDTTASRATEAAGRTAEGGRPTDRDVDGEPATAEPATAERPALRGSAHKPTRRGQGGRPSS